MVINTEFLRRCLDTLEYYLKELERSEPDEITYDAYRAACVKEFEIILEQSGKLLRKVLSAYFADNSQADRLVFKDIFRYAAKHGLIDPEPVSVGFFTETTAMTRYTAMEKILCREYD